MNRKDQTVFRGCFAGLRLTIFSSVQVLAGEYDVTVYQVRANPPLWCGSPAITPGEPQWRGRSAEEVMLTVAAAFEREVSPFLAITPDGSAADRRSSPPRLNSAAEALARRRNRLGA